MKCVWEDDPILPKCIITAFMKRVRMPLAISAMLHGLPLLMLCLEPRENGCNTHSRHLATCRSSPITDVTSKTLGKHLLENDRVGPPVWSVNPDPRQYDPGILLLNPRALPDVTEQDRQ